MQYNWFKLQDYYQHGQLEYLSETYGADIERVCFQYVAANKDKAASLSFHLTTREKNEIAASLYNDLNIEQMKKIKSLIR